jgi:hypothetical protein
MALLKPLNESAATPIAGRQSYMTAGGQKVLLEDMERIRY